MKILVQRFQDGLFLKADGQWTVEKSRAKNFVHCTPAINHSVEHGLKNVRLWFSFENPAHDFPIEVFRVETRVRW